MTIKTTLPTSDWSNGITDKTIYNGVLFKTGLYNELLNNDIIIADTGIKFNCDATSIKNYLKFDGMIYTQDYSSPVISNASALTRRKIKVTGSDTYDLGKCLDIKYVARYLTSNVTEVISTTQLKVNDEVSESIENYDSRLSLNNLGGKLVCNIIDATGDHNIREFTISGGVITLSSALSSLAVNNTFELISALDILKEGLEQTTGYPDKGYCIKSIKPDSNSTIKFGYFDVPPLAVNSYIIVYTNQIAPFKPEYIFSDSIKRNCLYISNEKLDFPITQEQFDILLAEYKKYIESKKEYILTTYRPNECQIGWKIPINLNYLPKGVYTVTDVEIESIEPTGQLNGKHLIKQRVKLSNYFDNLNSLLAGFKNTSKLDQVRIAEAVYNTSFINFKMITLPGLITLAPPTLTTYSFPLDNALTVNWSTYTDSIDFYIQVSLNDSFTSIVSQGYIGNVTSNTFIDAYIESNDTFYVRLKVKTLVNVSGWSDPLEINKNTYPVFSNNHAWNLKYDNSGAMTGTGTSITDSITGLVANFYRNLSHNGAALLPQWVTDAVFGNGIKFTTNTAALRIADNTVLETPEKATWFFLLKFNEIDRGHQLLEKSSLASQANQSHEMSIESTNKTQIVLPDEYLTGNSKYFITRSDNAILETADIDTVIGIAITYNVTTKVLKVIKNQTTFNWSVLAGYGTFAGITMIDNSTMDLFIGDKFYDNGTNYISGYSMRAELYGIAMIKDDLTESEIKAEWAQMGLT